MRRLASTSAISVTWSEPGLQRATRDDDDQEGATPKSLSVPSSGPRERQKLLPPAIWIWWPRSRMAEVETSGGGIGGDGDDNLQIDLKLRGGLFAATLEDGDKVD